MVEPAADLAAVAAIASSFKEIPLSGKEIIFGEVGLGGEIRAVAHVELRINEAKKLGFERVILPKNNLKGLEEKSKKAGISLIGVSSVKEALDIILG